MTMNTAFLKMWSYGCIFGQTKIFRYLQEHEKLRYKHSEKGWAKNIEEALEKAKLALKEAFQLDTFFEKLGIVYLGPLMGTTWSLCL